MSAEVYRAFDADDRLLYVGSSVTVDYRLRYHSQHSPWWPFHTRIERAGFPTIKAAREAEAAAIWTEHPRWNVVGRSPDHPDGLISSHGRFATPWLRKEINQWREWKRTKRTTGATA